MSLHAAPDALHIEAKGVVEMPTLVEQAPPSISIRTCRLFAINRSCADSPCGTASQRRICSAAFSGSWCAVAQSIFVEPVR
jgi:hypothetical protein